MDEIKTTQATQDIEPTQPAEELNLVLNDHKISVPVKNQFGEQIGIFRFDPTDVNMVKRYNEVAEKFANTLRDFGDAEGIEALNAAGDKIIDFLDYVLGGNSREAFFAQTHPLSPQDGRFYCEQVFDVIGDFIARKFDAETATLNKRLSAQTHGYRSGKHAKGEK